MLMEDNMFKGLRISLTLVVSLMLSSLLSSQATHHVRSCVPASYSWCGGGNNDVKQPWDLRATHNSYSYGHGFGDGNAMVDDEAKFEVGVGMINLMLLFLLIYRVNGVAMQFLLHSWRQSMPSR